MESSQELLRQNAGHEEEAHFVKDGARSQQPNQQSPAKVELLMPKKITKRKGKRKLPKIGKKKKRTPYGY